MQREAAPTDAVRVVGTAFLRLRPLLVAPQMALSLAALVSSDVPRQQLLMASVGMTFGLLFFVGEAVRAGRRLFSERELFVDLVITLVVLSVGSAILGGLESPTLPLLFAPTGVALAAFGRTGKSALFITLFLVAVGVLAALPSGVPFSPPPDVASRVILVGALAVTVGLLGVGVAGLTSAFSRATATLETVGDEVVAQASGRTAALEALGARVAHEVKNPLTSVRGLVELLMEGQHDDKTRQRLQVIDKEAGRLSTILEEYLSFVRPFLSLQHEPRDVAALSRDVIDVLEARARRRGVTLAAPREPFVASCDGQRVKEALFNLVLNALDATPAGGEVRVSFTADEHEDRVVVSDTGPGVDAATAARVGTAFFTTKEGGTGLGVALARQVAKDHGGDLLFESEPGRGTAVTLTLPRRAPDA